MFKFYNHCIFCIKKLPAKPNGVGEHVIPKNIYGFWRSHDICEEFKQYFGDNIDQIPLQNIKILNAMTNLNLPNADKLFEHLPYRGIDTINKRKISMIRRDDEFEIKSTVEDKDFLECSENDWENFLVRWLENSVGDRVEKDKFDREIKRLKVKYDALKPGETVLSNLLNYSIRKRQTHNVEVNREALPPISRFIAKIDVFFLRLVLSPQQIKLIPAYEMLVRHARYEGELEKPLINWCARAQTIEYYKFHKLAIQVFENVQIIDVTLFGYPNWRTMLGSTSPIIIEDREGNKLEGIRLILDFEDLGNREKYIGLKYTGESRARYYKI